MFVYYLFNSIGFDIKTSFTKVPACYFFPLKSCSTRQRERAWEKLQTLTS